MVHVAECGQHGDDVFAYRVLELIFGQKYCLKFIFKALFPSSKGCTAPREGNKKCRKVHVQLVKTDDDHAKVAFKKLKELAQVREGKKDAGAGGALKAKSKSANQKAKWKANLAESKDNEAKLQAKVDKLEADAEAAKKATQQQQGQYPPPVYAAPPGYFGMGTQQGAPPPAAGMRSTAVVRSAMPRVGGAQVPSALMAATAYPGARPTGFLTALAGARMMELMANRQYALALMREAGPGVWIDDTGCSMAVAGPPTIADHIDRAREIGLEPCTSKPTNAEYDVVGGTSTAITEHGLQCVVGTFTFTMPTNEVLDPGTPGLCPRYIREDVLGIVTDWIKVDGEWVPIWHSRKLNIEPQKQRTIGPGLRVLDLLDTRVFPAYKIPELELAEPLANYEGVDYHVAHAAQLKSLAAPAETHVPEARDGRLLPSDRRLRRTARRPHRRLSRRAS